MSYFQSFHFFIFSFPQIFFLSKRCIFGILHSGMSYFQSFHFLIFSLPQTFFLAKRCISGVLRSGMSYFQSFHFSIFSFPEAFFSQNAAFPEFCALECLISKVLIFRFLASQKLFFAKRCISGVLHSGMSYFQTFHFSIFSFPQAFFSEIAAFPEFCTLEFFISKVFIFRFLASEKLFFAKLCISGVLRSGMSYFQTFHFSIFSFPEAIFLRKTLHFRSSALWNVLFPKFIFFDF